MARLARLVIPDVPHHVTQRGNRRQPVFFSDEDYAAYRDLVTEACAAHGVHCLAWCLMPNHVHLILTPRDEDGLRAALADAHRRYSRRINFAHGWTGYLWQGRFASYPMDEAHLMTAIRYVELNPVKAQLVARAEDWPWSSAGAHVSGKPDGLTDLAALSGLYRKGLSPRGIRYCVPGIPGRSNINIEDIRQDIGLVVIFMIYSGYFVTTFGAESIFHKHELIKKFWFGNALFALHGGIFAVFASDDNIHWTLLVFLGLGGVTFAGLLVESASVCFGHFRGHNS